MVLYRNGSEYRIIPLSVGIVNREGVLVDSFPIQRMAQAVEEVDKLEEENRRLDNAFGIFET